MKGLKKIQDLPEGKKKAILWLITIIIGLFLLVWWGSSFQGKINFIKTNNILKGVQWPEINMPQLPDISTEEIQKIIEDLPKTEENATETNETGQQSK
ncbi:MAG: hypothetical protein Q8P63_01740 [Candidatus Nealsonbacteria bacterium]|nr:hypothetical protein [Candidatus Nealsonbacteria bacterium]